MYRDVGKRCELLVLVTESRKRTRRTYGFEFENCLMRTGLGTGGTGVEWAHQRKKALVASSHASCTALAL